MTPDKGEISASTPPEATPVQAGTFTLGSAFLRVLPTLGWLPFNYAPVGGLAVFAGARVRTWLAYGLPLVLMLATDLVLWAYTGQNMYSPLHISRPFVYGSYLGYVLLGRWLGGSLLGIGAAALLGSVQFYLVTNFASWVELTTLYPRTLDGLMNCYLAGVPFYRGTFLSDLCFPFLFVGLHQFWVWASQPAPTEEATLS